MKPTEHPAAIVRTHAEVRLLVQQLKTSQEALAKTERLNLTQAIAQGRLLNILNTICPRGDWQGCLDLAGIKQQRASERMKIAKLPAAVISNCLSIRDALEACKTTCDESTESPAEPSFQATHEQVEHSNTTTTEVLCGACTRRRRVGQPMPHHCPDCAEVRRVSALRASPEAAPPAEPAPEPPPAEPGDAYEGADVPTAEEAVDGGVGAVEVDLDATAETPAEGDAHEGTTPRDTVGHTVPDHLIPAFETAARFYDALTLTRQMERTIDEISGLDGGEQLRRFLKPTGSEGNTKNKSEHINALKRDLKGTRPYSVCPVCRGDRKPDCKGCSGIGWVTEICWKGMTDDLKARLPL